MLSFALCWRLGTRYSVLGTRFQPTNIAIRGEQGEGEPGHVGHEAVAEVKEDGVEREQRCAQQRAPGRHVHLSRYAIEGVQPGQREDQGGVRKCGKTEAEQVGPERAPEGQADQVSLRLAGHLERAGRHLVLHRLGVYPIINDGILVLRRDNQQQRKKAQCYDEQAEQV